MPSPVNIRRRKRAYGKSWSRVYTRASKTQPWVLQSEPDNTLLGGQITASEGHPFQNHFGNSDVGGPFTTAKVEATGFVGSTVAFESADKLTKVVGSLRNPNSPSSSSSTKVGQTRDLSSVDDVFKNTPSLDELGSTAIALCAPTNPLVKLNTTLAETFREGLPKLPGVPTWRDRAKRLRGLGTGEFLNAEFAWKPLISEIGETADLVQNFAKIVNQYKRDEGRLVRRQFHFDVETDESSALQTANAAIRVGPSSSQFVNSDGLVPRVNVFQTIKTERKTWFSGAFRYHIPDSIIGNIIGAATGASEFTQNLLGDSLTPELLWELTPWSWAVDYFSNAQQVLTNLQNMELYGLFMAYGYIMDENIRTVTHSAMPVGNSPPGPACPTYSEVEIRKMRRQANPYGFGVSWDDLSPTQVAILAAAGISRLL